MPLRPPPSLPPATAPVASERSGAIPSVCRLGGNLCADETTAYTPSSQLAS